MDEFVNALVGVYRTLVGPGMSSYMEAFSPATGMMPATLVAGPGMAGPPGAASAATMMAGGVPGVSSPTPPPYGAQGYGQPSGPMPGYPPAGNGYPPPGSGPTPGYPPPGSGPYAGPNPAASAPYFNADSSQFAMSEAAGPKKSKVGLIAALLILVIVGGGIAAVVVLSGKKKSEAGTTDPVATIDAGGGVAMAEPDAGAGGAIDPPATIDAGAGAALEDVDAATAVPTSDVDAATAVPTSDVDAGIDDPPSLDVVVLITSNAKGAIIYVDGKELGKAPKNLKVTPGTTHEVRVKAKGYKDKTVTVDGLTEEVKVKLDANGGTRPPKIDCTDPANALSPDCMG
ncbi:MAG: PEGA domain-containing protein [Myxococcales bacterium]|nr:PEGA domain-containing protein [Myxococcales bacterium]